VQEKPKAPPEAPASETGRQDGKKNEEHA